MMILCAFLSNDSLHRVWLKHRNRSALLILELCRMGLSRGHMRRENLDVIQKVDDFWTSSKKWTIFECARRGNLDVSQKLDDF